MKLKFIFMIVAMALLVSNCSKEEMSNALQKEGVSRLTVNVEDKSRSSMTGGGTFSWVIGDALSVYDANTQKFVSFICDGDNIFSIDPNAGVTSVDPANYAIYPAGDYQYSSESIEISLPDNYVDKSPVYTPNTHAPMLAFVDENNKASLQFRHVGGLMRFVVKDVPVGAHSFEFTSLDQGITGDFIVENEVISVKEKNANNTVSIRFTQTTSKSDMIFFIPLPTGTYTGYSVTITGKDGMNLSHTSENAVNTINRRTMLLMPTFTCVDDKLKKATTQSVDLYNGESVVNIQDATNVVVGTDNVDTGENAEDAVLNLNLGENVSDLNISDNRAGGESDASSAQVNVSVPGNAQIDNLNINAPTLTIELKTNGENDVAIFNEVTAKTAVNTLRINRGVTVGTLYLNGGNVVIDKGATVKNIVNAPGFTGKTYVVGKPTNTPNLSNIEYMATEPEMNLKIALEKWNEYSMDADVVLSKPLVINKDFKIHGNGHKITNETDFWNEEKKDWSLLSVQGGNVTLIYSNLIAKENDCYAIDVRNGATLEILGGQNDSIQGNVSAVYVHEGTANIHGGHYSIQQLSSYNDERYTLNCFDDNYKAGKAVINLDGDGIYFNKGFNPADNLAEGPNTDFVKSGYSVMDMGDYYKLDCGIKNEWGLRTAVKKSEDGQVTLDEDIVLSKPLVISKDFTIHGNGHKITNETDFWNEEKKDWSLLSVQGGNVTLINSNLIAKENDCYAIDVRNGATLEILGGQNDSIQGNVSAVYVHEGTANIHGGHYSIQQLSSYNDERYTLNCFDDNYKAGKAVINLDSDGIYFSKGFNPANNLAEGPNTDFVSSGLSVVEVGDYYRLEWGIKNEWGLRTAVNKCEDEYPDLWLDGDIVLSQQLVINRNMAIHTNGHTISNTQPIKDVDSQSWSLISVQGGEVIIDGNLQALENDCYAIDVRNGAILTVTGGNSTIVGNVSAVYVHEGTANIHDGNYSTYGDASFTLDCDNENYKSNRADIEVIRGSFKGFNPQNNKAEGDKTNFLGIEVYMEYDESTGTWIANRNW